MATLRDGLGGEELAESGLQAGATSISPYFTGSINTESDVFINSSTGVYKISAATGATGTMSGLTISGGLVVAIA